MPIKVPAGASPAAGRDPRVRPILSPPTQPTGARRWSTPRGWGA